MESIEDLMKKYKLSYEEHNKIEKDIQEYIFKFASPVLNPTAIIIGGQTGAGKGHLITYSYGMFPDGNTVVINSDEFKEFHPSVHEISKKYPEHYTRITDQDSNTWTSNTFEKAIKGRYNIIFEGTMRNTRIADTIDRLLNQEKYSVIVRALAVPELESLLSIHERYEMQISAKDVARFVELEHHNSTYTGMINTLEYIEKEHLYSQLEIYKRGEVLIYSDSERNGFSNVIAAVKKGRREEGKKTLSTFEGRYQMLIQTMKHRGAEDREFKQLLQVYKRYLEIVSEMGER